jgi:wyosine [tRNA(Phe)-imidazoG37] synthetase (radical SAM superfamily)
MKAQISTENILCNAERPDAREIINSFDLLKLTLNANVESMIINGIAKDR